MPWPHSLFLPRRCKAPSAYGVQGRAEHEWFQRHLRPFLASSLAFTTLEVVAMASPPWRNGFVSAGDHRVVFDQREANTHKFSANGAAIGGWVSSPVWPLPFAFIREGWSCPRGFHDFDGHPSLTRYYSATHGVLVTGHLRPPMAGQSRPTIFFLPSWRSSIVFSRNPHSSHSPSCCRFVFRVFCPVGFLCGRC